jgi:hypothetical protein
MSETTTESPGGARTGRSRDAAASKGALLQAAQTHFGQQGFDGTTIREIGERAGVDAALIARYFGSKADLYIAAVAAEDGEGTPASTKGWNRWPTWWWPWPTCAAQARRSGWCLLMSARGANAFAAWRWRRARQGVARHNCGYVPCW